jgi:glycosyltransferase involved in cell wall biosynthesis
LAVDAVLTCCRDEADVIGAFVLFYLDLGFDTVHVVDNGSVDRTADIVRELIAAGLPVTLQRDGRLGYERHLTEWFHATGRRLKPRWLFFLDCDEFILLPRPARVWLDALPPDVNRLRLRQREIYPARDGSGSAHFLLSRRSEPHFNDTTKDVVRYHPDVRVYGGKHLVDTPDARTVHLPDVFIRHYKYRSVAQARRKEGNRTAAKRVYTDADLARISATGIGPAREWIEHCERAAAEERWRESFDPPEWVEDGELADWAAGFLERTRTGAPGTSTAAASGTGRRPVVGTDGGER